jgi:hypothetical protein
MKYLPLLPRFWKTILVLMLIVGLCLIPAKELVKIDFLKISYEDLAVHLMMFFGFSSVLFIDLQRNTELAGNMKSLSFTVLLFCIALGITTELLQLVLTSLHRSGNIIDFLLDMAGTGLGIAAMRFIRQ